MNPSSGRILMAALPAGMGAGVAGGAEVIIRPHGNSASTLRLTEVSERRRGHSSHWAGHQGCKKFEKRRAAFKAAKKARAKQRGRR